MIMINNTNYELKIAKRGEVTFFYYNTVIVFYSMASKNMNSG